MKKMILLALAAASVAMFALPAVASATPNHINATSNFNISGGTAQLSTAGGSTIHCGSVSGTGAFTTTTGGNITLTFTGTCSTNIFGFNVHCNSSGKTGGHIATTTLPFDLVTLPGTGPGGTNGILVTSSNNHFASFQCAGVNQVVEGNGVIGTLTSPACGAASTTATAVFQTTQLGVQKHTSYTNITYGLKKGGEPAGQTAHATITFPQSRTLVCT